MEAQDKPQRGSPLRHPLVTVLVAFLLTGVLGTQLSNYYHNQQADRDRFLDTLKIRRAAIREFAGFIYGRRTRAEMLYSSLLRQAPLDEVRERKRLYDQTYAAWGARLQSNLFLIRSVLDAEAYTDFEGHVEFRLIPIFRRIDQCLTSAYDLKLRNREVRPTLKKCGLSDDLQLALDCSYVFTGELFSLATPHEQLTPDERTKRRKEANQMVIERCGSI